MDSIHIPEHHVVRLTNPEKESLHRAMKAGDPWARDRLIRSGLVFATDLALRYARRAERRLTPEVVDAYVSAARLGLVDAADKWDPGRSKFLNFVQWRARYYLHQEAMSRRAARETPADLWDLVDASDPPDHGAAARIDRAAAVRAVRDAVGAMAGRHSLMRETVLHYYGLEGRERIDQPELAARQGVGRHAISKRHVNSLKYLRQHLESMGITDAHL